MSTQLQKLVDSVRQRQMTKEEAEEQRINFAFGNAPEGEHCSIESIRATATILKESK